MGKKFLYYAFNLISVIIIFIYLQELLGWTWQWRIVFYTLYILRFARLPDPSTDGDMDLNTVDFGIIVGNLVLVSSILGGGFWLVRRYLKTRNSKVDSLESPQIIPENIPLKKSILRSIAYPAVIWPLAIILDILDKHKFDWNLIVVYLIFMAIHLSVAIWIPVSQGISNAISKAINIARSRPNAIVQINEIWDKDDISK